MSSSSPPDPKPASSDELRANPEWDTELSSPNYEIFIGLISMLSLINLVLFVILQGDEDLQGILSFMNVFLSLIFMADFTARLITSGNRREYFFRRFGWADLLGSLPFHTAKILRLFRLIRIYRVIRTFGLKKLLVALVKDRAGSSLFLMLLLGILVLEFGSLAVLRIEASAPGANITNASDALWYTIETISTVGYGDQFPVTNAGRIVGSMIIVLGVGIFGTFTGYLANFFIAPPKAKDQPIGESGS